MGDRDFSGEDRWRRSRIVVPVPQPAAGADWSLAAPAGHLYQLVSVIATLTTSAAVATRAARLVLGDGNATFLHVPAATTQVASLARRYGWWATGQVLAVGSDIESPLPGIALQTGWTIGSATDLVDVGDQWSAIRLHVIDTTVRDGATDIDQLPDIIVEVIERGQ